MYMYMYIYMYMHIIGIHVCMYVCMHVISPPLIITRPNKNKPWGEQIFVTINLDGGTITPLINDDFWFDLPPS